MKLILVMTFMQEWIRTGGITMQAKDSLGVPMEPKEPNPVAYDWQGEALYEDDKVYSTDHGLVLAEEIETFMKDLYGPPFELWEVLE